MVKKMINKETVLYLIFGILTTLINITSFYFLHKISYNLIITNSIACIISVLFAFITNKNIVFKSNGNIIKEILMFFLARLLSLLFDNIFMLILTETIGDMLAKIITNIFVIIINYILSKIFIFTKKDQK